MGSMEEKSSLDYPNLANIKETKLKLNQMKKSVAKIYNTDGSKGIGFFCKIPLSFKSYVPVFITNYHLIKEGNEIEIEINVGKSIQKINLEDKFKYASPEYDVIIIEMKEESTIEYLEFDQNAIKGNNLIFVGKSIYILHYPSINGGEEVVESYGIIKKRFEDKQYQFIHFCPTEDGSSGSPILNLSNNKIIGIHKARSEKQYNIGIFLFESINEFINKFKKKDKIKEINMDKLGIKDKKLFYKLYNKGLIKDFIQIKDRNLIIAYKFLLNQKKNISKYNGKWENAWHGTLYKYLGSIIKYGLKPPGTKLEDGTLTPKTKYVSDDNKILIYDGIKNWEKAIFASPKFFIAREYSENLFRCILEVKINKDKFTQYIPSNHGYPCITYEKAFLIDIPEYRISSADNIFVNSIVFINNELVDNIVKNENLKLYADIEKIIIKA